MPFYPVFTDTAGVAPLGTAVKSHPVLVIGSMAEPASGARHDGTADHAE